MSDVNIGKEGKIEKIATKRHKRLKDLISTQMAGLNLITLFIRSFEKGTKAQRHRGQSASRKSKARWKRGTKAQRHRVIKFRIMNAE